MLARKVGKARAQGVAKVAPHVQLSLSCRWYHTASSGRNCTSTTGCQFSRSVWYIQVPDHLCERDVPPDPLSDRKMTRENLWREFFSDPSQWWDHRSEKVNLRYPDFKHKKTGQSLWLNNIFNPKWVEEELATMSPGLLQSHKFSWHVRLRKHLKAEDYKETLNLFQQMQREGMMLDKFAFVPALSACSNLRSLEEGRRLHEQITQRGCDSDMYVANSLVDMYSKCGSIEDAWSVFNKMQERTVVSWSTMITGYVKSKQGLKALGLFQQMQQEGVEPNTLTFVGVLNACASVAALEEGRRVHELIIRRGCQSDVYVATCLVDMYAKCGSIGDAWNVFNKMRKRTVVSWSAMIMGYVKCEQGLKALELFRKMQQEGVEPNAVTFLGALNACASVLALEEGRRVHEQTIQRGCESNVNVGNCLVDMYAKCGSMEDAWNVFNKMRKTDVVSWSALIGGYVKSEQGLKALELFRAMQQEGMEPDVVTFVGALDACASIAALGEGRRVHEQIIRKGWESEIYVATCLVDMYAKCGSIEDAWNVFKKMQRRDRVSWNAMIGGYATHGHFKEAVGLFKRMGKEAVEINEITFTCLLSACSHGGLVKAGLRYFRSMTLHYNRPPSKEHYACMVDLLGRAGRLEEAEEITDRMPMQRHTSVWRSLLGACRIHGNIEMAERAAKRCWELDPENASGHVLLSNIYATAEKWDESAAIEKETLEREVWKDPGCSSIGENNCYIHCAVDDNEHPQLMQIHV